MVEPIRPEGTVTWRELLTAYFREVGDSWDNVVAWGVIPPQGDPESYNLPPFCEESALDYPFWSGYGRGAYCCPIFNLWTADYVYFVEEYDGSVGVGRAPRNPQEVMKPDWAY